MLVAQNSLGSVCPVPLTVRGNSLSFFWQRRCQMKPAPTTERTPGTLAYRICGAGKAAPACVEINQ
jgi:hypothetical protein